MIEVLLISTNESLHTNVRDGLDGERFLLFQARTGNEGISKAKSIHPQVFVCGDQLQDMNAEEVFAELEMLGLMTLTPFILISDTPQSQMIMASDVLAPDRVKETILSSIQRVLKNEQDNLDELNQIQHELNELESNIDPNESLVNTHKKQLIMVQKLFPFIRMGRLALSYAKELLESDAHVDEKVLEVNKAINDFRNRDDQMGVGRLKVKKIWLIDDDPAQNLLNKMVLKQLDADFIVSEFNDSDRALIALQKEQPDVIFLDINMPGMDGFAFLGEMKTKGINTRVIMLSSSLTVDEIRQSLGFEQVLDYFTKPIDRARVKRLIDFSTI